MTGGQEVVNEAAVVEGVPRYANRRLALDDRQVDESFIGIVRAAVVYFAAVEVNAGAEGSEVGFHGDGTDGAGHGARAVQRPLRAVQDLDPLHVVVMQIRNAAVIA